jgi:N-acetylmuramoyl-L-alanine amidase
MFYQALPVLCLATVLLAGCGSAPRRNSAHVPDWGINEGISPATQSEKATPQAVPATSPAPTQPGKPPLATTTGEGPARPTVPTETWVALQRWTKANKLPPPAQLAAAPLPTFALRSANGTLVLHVGSQSASWEGLEVHLGFAPQWIDRQPYVHALDVRKTLQPLLTGSPEAFQNANPVVVLDPGHGGENGGTRSVLGNRYEKEFTLDWARRLQTLLAANGWQVFLTRSNDSDLALSNRVAFAQEHKADLFLSLHFNSAAPNETEAGLETYCLTPAGMPSNLTRGFDDTPAQTFPNNAYDSQNLLLALSVHRALLQVNGHHDRGVRHARFPAVLRGQQRPAILVEGGYLSNPREARLIADPSYRQKLAEAVAKALLGCVRRET